MPDRTEPTKPAPRCPICGEPRTTTEYAPFCSKRCRQIDLGRWLDGRYVVSRPVEQSDIEEGD